ncbi:15,15' beta carotene dioxygenase [Longispora fulva]|uniref:Dioxygenase n=1 Tax=Longispora fulva TaxID=619741 RepID=A0A8J7GRP6_9ACTN|nr:carotenoid oxygenase family protein [Longispora fulva]MBG6136978.1 carotenoid cleavage dioxygenase-like enzyme [Longispora fulva]GIG61669.1 15,15' beta carotene dioxygenase [Longispora fulva]
MAITEGFDSLRSELTDAPLPVRGALPGWLSGTLIRNGPALFDAGGTSFRHWFDGQAMLHRFGFADGAVTYTNRFLDTPGLRSARDDGRIGYTEFATDPCASLFGRFFSRFRRGSGVNPNVNISRYGEHDVALTEVPMAVEFDHATLATIGVLAPDSGPTGNVTTAHPHEAPGTGDLVNFVLRFGPKSSYQVYRQPAGGTTRHLLGTVTAARPGYVHSFAVTEHHAVLAIFPLVVNPLSFFLRGRPFIENYRWRPELGTRIVVMDLRDGSVRADHTAPPFFAFHHINAFEDGGRLVLDVCAYEDARIIDALYLDRLRAGDEAPVSHPTRYTVDLDTGGVDVRRLSDEPMELPRIAYRTHNGRPYRYAYGVGTTTRRDLFDQLVKLDTHTGETRLWHVPGSYPGEPVFVPAPGSTGEDDGVVLSVVLDGDAGRSALVVLDAASWAEVARAEVPHVVPFGFHGQFSHRA